MWSLAEMNEGGIKDPQTLYSSPLEEGPIINQSMEHLGDSSTSKFLKLPRQKRWEKKKEDIQMKEKQPGSHLAFHQRLVTFGRDRTGPPDLPKNFRNVYILLGLEASVGGGAEGGPCLHPVISVRDPSQGTFSSFTVTLNGA